MEGLERLEAEVTALNDCSITKIFNYLKTRTDLYEKFNDEEKTAEGMYEYIYTKASKHQHHHMAIIDDNVVYLWAITYFSKTNEELGIKEKKVMPPKPAEVIKGNEQKANKEDQKQEEKKPKNNQITLFQEV